MVIVLTEHPACRFMEKGGQKNRYNEYEVLLEESI